MKKSFILLATVLGLVSSISAADLSTTMPLKGNNFEETSIWRFAVIPDTQGAKYSDGKTHEPTIILDAITKEIKDRNVDFVLNVGDITDKRTNGEYQEWVSSMSPLLEEDIAVYPVRGNHEVVDGKDWNGWKADGEAHVVGEYDSGAALWKNYTNPLLKTVTKMPGENNLSYYFIHNNALMIGLDLYDSDINQNMYRGAWIHLYPWLQEVIESHKNQVEHIVVFAHEPFSTRKRPHAVTSEEYITLMDPNGGKISRSDISQLGLLKLQTRSQKVLMENLFNLFTENNVQYIAGHDHQYSRSLIHEEENNTESDYFYQTIAGNASFKSYTNNYGVCSCYETGLAQDNLTGQTSGASFLLYEIKGNQITTEYWYANHELTEKDQEAGKVWDNAEWTLGDRVSYTTDATQYTVGPRENYWGISQTPKSNNYIGTSAAILEGYNQIFNIYETKGEKLVAPKADYMSELISYSWFFDKSAKTLSDICLIDGMQGQSGVRVTPEGQVTEDQTHIPEGLRSENVGKDFSYNDVADTYAFSLSVPKNINLKTTTIGRFDEKTGKWVDILKDKKFVPTAYSDDFMTGAVPDGTDATVEDAYNLWGYNYQTHTIWAMLDTDGYFAVIKK